ncbi:MAG: glycosyltransferase [Desulfobacteraceae bacterium]
MDSGIRPLNKSLRIAMLSLHSSPLGPLGTRDTGGMSVYVREVAREMACIGHSVDIYTYVPCSGDVTILYPDVRLIELDHGRKPEISKEALKDYLPEMIRALDRFVLHHQLSYDLVHSHYWISACVGTSISKKWECPHLITFHTLGLVKNRTTKGEAEPEVRISHERQLMAGADAVVVPSNGESRHLLDLYGAASEKLHTIPCGVNKVQFRPADQRQSRCALNIDPAATVLLFVGRFAPVKGVPTLLQAMARLARRHASIHLVVVGGDGEQAATTAQIRSQADALGILGLLQITGRIDHEQLPLYYTAADLLVVPSTYESFGLVTLESLACGTPVVATRVGGAAAVIREGVNGILVDRPDSTALADGIERVLDGIRRRQFSPQRVRNSISAYGWDRVASAILSVYNGALQRQKYY